MTINVGGGGGGGGDSGIPAMPQGIIFNSVKNLGGAGVGPWMPLLSLANNGKTSIRQQIDNDNLVNGQEFLLNGVLQYDINMPDIDAATGTGLTRNTGFIWYDNVDLATYQIYTDNSNNYSLIKIENNGTITNIGTDTSVNYGFVIITTNVSSTNIMTRAAHGSGDFTLSYVEEASAGVREVVTVSATTGLASGNAPFILSGAVLTPAGGITYITADGTAALGQTERLAVISSGTVKTSLPFLRADGYQTLDMSRTHTFTFNVTNPTYTRYMLWDDVVVASQAPENTEANVSVFGPRVYQRAEFDAWIQECCDFLGLPV